MGKTYISYGSNMNIGQMKRRCPTAKVIGTGELLCYELLFRGGAFGAVATVEPQDDCSVPVVLWDIKPRDEEALDRYEGYPYLYRKENIEVQVGEEMVSGMIYIMNDGRPIGLPSEGYFETILEGYEDNGLDPEPLFEACYKCKEQLK